MNTRNFAAVIALLLLTTVTHGGPRDELWTQVQQAIQQGRPQTAIAKLEPIIAAALEDGDHGEAVKAITKKIALEGQIQGGKPEEKIVRLQAAIDEAPAEMKPVMRAILAHWYWQYFQQNRWQIMQRSRTAAPPSDDLKTWDLPRVLAAIDETFQQALSNEKLLQSTPVEKYAELLEKGNAPASYRPTLYDFIAHNALEFYATGEQAAARPQDAFYLSAGSPVFAPLDEFMAWKPDPADEQSPTLAAIRLYQRLLRFHRDDKDPSALLDADLLRLKFAFNQSSGEEKTARHQAALRRFAQRHADHPISARALHELAESVHGQGDWVEAREIARQGMARAPDSVGANRCYNLIQRIEAPEARTSTERVWNEPRATIDVTYRNLSKIHFRAIPLDFEQFAASNRWSPESLSHQQRLALLRVAPVKSWSADLPPTPDYQLRTEQLAAPADVPPGSYYLIASHEESFTADDNHVSFCEFWVSDLALVTRVRHGDGALEGLVVDAKFGEPIAGAKVRSWVRDQRGHGRPGPTTRTDELGFFRIDGQDRHHLFLLAEHDGQRLASAGPNYLSRNGADEPFEQTVFFTDRSLYRPGQTIRFKGICLKADRTADNYEVLRNRTVKVVFSDVNGKEIERLALTTNDYGSISGSFTAPRDRLMGAMTIHTDGDPGGSTRVTVEEYKRPKFQVQLQAPQQGARLDEMVQLQGKASAYTGAAIDGAKVRWRVVRNVRYPAWYHWRCWWHPVPANPSQEIAHGTTTTSPGGTFDLEFPAKPDPTVDASLEPVFQFTVHADVVDGTGETRSDQRVVSVGYTALAASVSADPWQTADAPVELSVSTTTLDGVGQQAEGTLRIHSLKQPEAVHRASFSSPSYRRVAGDDPPSPDPSNPNSWALDELVVEQGFTTDAGGGARVSASLPAGIYRVLLETADRFGKTVTAQAPLQVLDPRADHLGIKVPMLLAAPDWTVEAGAPFTAVWGSGYERARAFVEVEHRGKLLQRFWTAPGVTQLQIEQQVTERMRGGFTLRVTMVRENRGYLESQYVSVPWSNKQLTVEWEHFVSKLEPAVKETWTAVVRGADAKSAVAEMVAGMYDASLDAYLPHNWPAAFNVFYRDSSSLYSQFQNVGKQLQQIVSWNTHSRDGSLTYWHLPWDVIATNYYWDKAKLAASPYRSADRGISDEMQLQRKDANRRSSNQPADSGPDLSKVAPRKDLDATAFFFPHLVSDADGAVRIEFTMPETLTEWKFLGFAHDAQLRGGLLTDSAVSSKELMIQPNPPRFIREGDTIHFTVKVSNQSPAAQTGTVRLTLSDAASGRSVDQLLGNSATDQSFEIPAGQSKSFSWKLSVPDDLATLTYTAVGSTGRLSDGEEGFLPVLSRRVLVTESLPLPIRDATTRQFDFEHLLKSGESDSLSHKSLTVQMVSNPSWYAVMALPYLMEFPHECTEQTFNRLYANALARHIASSDPRIRRVFDLWKQSGGDTLDSPLLKNEDLKAVTIEETPWLRQAQDESQARRNVGILFDANRLDSETARLLRKLAEMQYENGLWPWFPGGPDNRYMTLYITTGFGRMRHLGVDIDVAPAVKSLSGLDAWADEMYRAIPADKRNENHLTPLIALYLYGRSFFLDDQAVADEHLAAVRYWQSQAQAHWLGLSSRQSQAHVAVALRRMDDGETPQAIMTSLKERSVRSEELGMFWRDLERSLWWHRAPIETQAMMIEALDEVAGDREAVEDCKVWLLKQKQTQDWKTTKATADAVYALLLRGADVLASDELVSVSLAGERIEPADVEAGTGFYEARFGGAEIRPQLGTITVTKRDPGVAWGSVHWQYLEDMSKIPAYEGTPLQLTKTLYTKRNTEKGPVLSEIDGPVEVGDELVARVVLRTDRDMEYVHLKDYRGSGTEPVNVLSQYKFQDGLYYYESTRDAASHFFIDYLPKGVYVFEYSVRVQLRGEYQTGFAQIQCMYAPEFNSHSNSVQLEVR